MRVGTWMLVLAAGSLASAALAGDGKTGARSTAEAGFGALRKAAADHDDATLAICLPAKLVAGWPDESAAEAKTWRAGLAARIAAGAVVSVKEDGDSAVARWKTTSPDATWETRLAYEGGRWVAASPWAYCVGGGDLAKANGKGAAHVKLKARTTDAYGASAFSFVHATQDGKQCLNRVDVVYCRCGQIHGRKTMISQRRVKGLDDLDGIQSGGDWMDEIVPKNGAVYVLDCKEPGRKDFQVAVHVTSMKGDALEFDWRIVAAGKNAPASIRVPQPCKENAGADGEMGLCGERGK